MNRCKWCGSDPLYIAYHDDEWGIPVHDDRLLFEFLILEGAQAGLSWLMDCIKYFFCCFIKKFISLMSVYSSGVINFDYS